MTTTLRLALVQYNDENGPMVFAAGWDFEPGDALREDPTRLQSVKDLSKIPDKFITSVRFIEVPVPITETELRYDPNCEGFEAEDALDMVYPNYMETEQEGYIGLPATEDFPFGDSCPNCGDSLTEKEIRQGVCSTCERYLCSVE